MELEDIRAVEQMFKNINDDLTIRIDDSIGIKAWSITMNRIWDKISNNLFEHIIIPVSQGFLNG